MGVGVKTWSRKECLAFMTCVCVAFSDAHSVLAQTRSAAGPPTRSVDTASDRRSPAARSTDATSARSSSPGPSPSKKAEPAEDEQFTIRDFHVQGNNLLMPEQVD